jgi:hypothetical protein
MDHQGSGRSRPAADAPRRAPWPDSGRHADPDSTQEFTRVTDEPGVGTGLRVGPGPTYGRGSLPGRHLAERGPEGGYPAQGTRASGPQQAIGPGSGPAPVLGYGSGAQRVLGPGTGPQRLIGPGSGPRQSLGTGSGAQPVLGTGSGAQPVPNTGSGAQPVLGTGSGAQPVLGLGAPSRTPVRGFPPGRREASPDSFTPWHAPREPLTGEDDHAPAGGRQPADTGAMAWEDADTMVWGQPRTASDTTTWGEPPAASDTTTWEEPRTASNTTTWGEPRTPMVPAGRRRDAKAKPERRSLSRAALVAAAVIAAVAAVGFAGYKFFYVPRVNAPVSSALKLPTSAPGSPNFDKSLGKWQHIGTRAEDPAPLTIEELYPPAFDLGGNSYVRTAASVTKSCSLAVYGANLQAALQSGKCTQVARATYISGNGQMMGTIGVVNLSTSALAQKAGTVTGPQEIIAPLAAQKGATKKLGSGTGVEQAEIKGHYLILMWAEFANLKSPSTSAARQLLETFADDLLSGSANINLSSRLLNSKP